MKEIDLAFNLLSNDKEEDKGKDPIDSHYDKLKTEITVLGRDTEEWSVLEEYVKNTHAATHTQYSLHIEEIFKVSRKGEAKSGEWHHIRRAGGSTRNGGEQDAERDVKRRGVLHCEETALAQQQPVAHA